MTMLRAIVKQIRCGDKLLLLLLRKELVLEQIHLLVRQRQADDSATIVENSSRSLHRVHLASCADSEALHTVSLNKKSRPAPPQWHCEANLLSGLILVIFVR